MDQGLFEVEHEGVLVPVLDRWKERGLWLVGLRDAREARDPNKLRRRRRVDILLHLLDRVLCQRVPLQKHELFVPAAAAEVKRAGSEVLRDPQVRVVQFQSVIVLLASPFLGRIQHDTRALLSLGIFLDLDHLVKVLVIGVSDHDGGGIGLRLLAVHAFA